MKGGFGSLVFGDVIIYGSCQLPGKCYVIIYGSCLTGQYHNYAGFLLLRCSFVVSYEISFW